MNIYLVRHGEKEQNPKNPSLTSNGKIQAQKTANFFSNSKIDKIISSPLLRAKQTAQIISESLNLKIKIDNKLLERANWDGNINFNNFLSEWIKASKNRNLKSDTGDSSIYTGKRIEKTISTYSNNKNQDIILVSHGGTITDFLRNIYSDNYLIKIYFKNIENLYNCKIPECSITHLVLKNSKYKLEKICYTEHIE